MKQQLFQRTTIRLTAVYLGILMMLSIVFSIALYRVSIADLNHNYNRAVEFARGFGGFQLFPGQREIYVAERRADLEKGSEHLIDQLLVLNAVILFAGGAFSYALARRTLEPIEEAHASLERFTADASHELRTPLTTMQTEIEVALMNKKLSMSESKKLLESNLEEVGRLSTLSDRLLLLARLDEHELPKEKMQAGEIVERAVDAVQARAENKQIAITTVLPKTALHCIGDATSLIEAVIILLDNAVKYSDEKAAIRVELAQKHKMAHITVSDNGIGIAPKDITRIFERFYRADQSRTKNAQHGHGLGLALAQKIVEQHSGTITVESKLGKGSTFTIQLPLAS